MKRPESSGASLFWVPFTFAFVIANWKFFYFLLRSDFDSEYILSVTDNLYQNNIYLLASTILLPTAFALAHVYVFPYLYRALYKRHQHDQRLLECDSSSSVTILAEDVRTDM